MPNDPLEKAIPNTKVRSGLGLCVAKGLLVLDPSAKRDWHETFIETFIQSCPVKWLLVLDPSAKRD